MKRFLSAVVLTSALLAAPVIQAASYQDRAMGTGAVVGATTGAVIGSSQNQAVEGAIFGAILGTIAGAVIASQHQPAYVVHQQPRTHYQPVAQHHEHRMQKPTYVARHHPRSHYKPVTHQYERRMQNNRQHERYVASNSYGHERGDRR